MGRPRLHSDEAMLDAATAVLLRVGPQRFTLTGAAAEIGVTRPALIQRFGPRESLLRAMADRQLALTRAWLNGLPRERSPAGLRHFLQGLVAGLDTGGGFAAHVALALIEADDPDLAARAAERTALVRGAIAARVPRGLALKPGRAATLLHAVMAGAILPALPEDGRPPGLRVQARLEELLTLLLPPDMPAG